MSESTLVKMPHCWKAHATAQIIIQFDILQLVQLSKCAVCGMHIDLDHSSIPATHGSLGASMRHFIEYTLPEGLGVLLPVYGARGEALWQKMVLGHFKGHT